ncbi:MAG: molybdopterin molybdotransferase MoeA [Saprospiraceae bacterium]|nr:molybdopterin molybdotransferase MoeA [Saprospiraceae bacterium]
MISVEEATQLLKQYLADWGTEMVPLENAHGRILREPVVADRDFPPFDRVAMDGVALRFAEWSAGLSRFDVAGQAPAGMVPPTLSEPASVVEVATGAVLPPGTDTVVPYEHLQHDGNEVIVLAEKVRKGQNIHRQGSDRQAGELLLFGGRRLDPSAMGVLATVGKSTVSVSRLPKTAILNTGDELVAVDATPQPWEIRMSNGWVIEGMLQKTGVSPTLFQCRDSLDELKITVKDILSEYDLIIITGAVSAGKRDHIPALLPELGIEKVFHKITQRPGKPLWFGQSKVGKTVFAMPGNPVSATLCASRYLMPWLNQSLGCSIYGPERVILGEQVIFEPAMTCFMPARLENREGRMVAFPKPSNGSGDLGKLPEADGFLELPAAWSVFNEGDVVDFYRL